MSGYYNPYIAVPLLTWAIAQFLKFVIKAAGGDMNIRYLYASGGMPSVHSASICSLAVTALAYGGFRSPEFGIAAVLAAVVMYDSFGVRRSVGDHAVAINALLANVHGKNKLAQLKLREVFGHRPSEVISGAVLGIFIAFLMTIRHWNSKIELVTVPPQNFERSAYLVIFATFVVAAMVAYVLLNKRHVRQTESYKAARAFVSGSLLGIGLLGLLVSAMQYAQVEAADWRLWSLLLLGLAVVLYALSWYYWLRFVPERIRRELSGK